MMFKHPHILYALGLVLIPVIIHLLRLQRFRTLDFPDISLLRKVEKQTRKRKKLREYILLAVRMLLIAALVTAFAGPFMPPAHDAGGGERFLYVDNSPSMTTGKGPGGRFTHVKQIAARLTGKGEWIWLRPEGEALRAGAKELSDLLSRYEPGCLPSRPRHIVNRFVHYDTLPKTLYFLTDGQGTDSLFWQSLAGKERYVFYLTDTSGFHMPVVDTLWIAGRRNGQYRLACRVRAPRSSDGLKFSALSGNRLLYAKSLTAKATADTLFFPWPEDVRNGVIRLQTPGGGAGFGATLFFRIPRPAKERILIVGNRIPPYWTKLFEAGGRKVEAARPGAIPYERAADFDMLVLHGWSPFLDAKALAQRFAKASMVFVPDGQTRTDGLFYQSLTHAAPEPDTTRLDINGIPWQHPFFRDVVKRPQGNLYAPFTSLTYHMPQSRGARVLIRTEDGRPFLWRQGRWTVFGGMVDRPRSDFYASPLMTAVFYKLLLEKNPSGKLYTVCRPDMHIRVQGKIPADLPVSLSGNGLRLTPYQKEVQGGRILFPASPRLRPGLYALTAGNDTLDFVALNIDRRETLPPPAPPSEDILPANVRLFTRAEDLVSHIRSGGTRDYARYLFMAALLLLLIEMILLRLWKKA